MFFSRLTFRMVKHRWPLIRICWLVALMFPAPSFLMAQTNETPAMRWLASVPVAPAFSSPGSERAWETRRKEIRGELWRLLGELPQRPKVPQVEILSREERDGFVVEKFQFDNEAGSIVPGYVLIPKGALKKAPGILYCHWHGGEYDIGKEELFQSKHTPEPPGPALARRGFVVLCIDACC